MGRQAGRRAGASGSAVVMGARRRPREVAARQSYNQRRKRNDSAKPEVMANEQPVVAAARVW